MNKKVAPNTTIALSILATAIFGTNTQAQEFSYSGDTGPGYWSELAEGWSDCASSAPDAAQSPINISKVEVDESLRRLDLQTYPTTIDVTNNGHTIQQSYADTGTGIYFEGQTYELRQFHFHTISEHTISSKHGVMEMHGVFANSAGGGFLVLGVQFKLSSQSNDFLQSIIDAGLPRKNGDTVQSSDLIDFADGVSTLGNYYTYQGSATTPPCRENVTWIVLAKAAKMTREQYAAFRTILGNNFRPIQAQNSRTVRATKNAVVPRGM